jgi:hypothetical protein
MLAMASAIAGFALAACPPRVGVDPVVVHLAPLAPPAPPARNEADSLAEEIVLANLFASNRTPPGRRYQLMDVAVDSATAGGEVGLPPDETAAASRLGPLLYGTIVRESGSLALLQVDPAAQGPQLFGVGDRAGPWRVVSIAAREVVLAGPAGRLVLRLPSQEERP